MNITEVEKIRGLVRVSAILSPAERAEWLALFDLMNDKQLGELEKILSGSNGKNLSALTTPTTPSPFGRHPSSKEEGNTAAPRLSQDNRGVSPPNIGGVPASAGEVVGADISAKPAAGKPQGAPSSFAIQPSRKATADKETSNFAKASSGEPHLSSIKTQMPKLSHIMNLPNLMPNFPKVSLEKQTPFSPDKLAKDLAQKKPSVFASRLKALFMEKELPAGRPEFELELPLPPAVPVPKIAVKPELPPKPVVESLKPLDLRKDFSLDQVLKLQQKSQVKTPAELRPEPGINFPKISEAGKTQIIKDLKEDVRDKQLAMPAEPVSPVLANEQALNSLQDLTQMGAEILRASALETLVKKIRPLIANYGYFEVIFNIEKSQAYKSYIATGLKLLSGQVNFESLSGREYLAKAEFEKFTDLLSKIQTG